MGCNASTTAGPADNNAPADRAPGEQIEEDAADNVEEMHENSDMSPEVSSWWDLDCSATPCTYIKNSELFATPCIKNSLLSNYNIKLISQNIMTISI